MSVPLCSDCRHAKLNFLEKLFGPAREKRYRQCLHPNNINPGSGIPENVCSHLRDKDYDMLGRCGSVGRWFEPREAGK